MKRLLHKSELQPIPVFHELYALHEDKFLLNPTEAEKTLVFMYSRIISNLRHELIECKEKLLDTESKSLAQFREIARLTEAIEILNKNQCQATK